MKTIIVSGKASGVGKTTLITKIIKKLANLTNKIGVIKCSINDEFIEPEVIDDIDVINTPGTDTALCKKAGANRVILIKCNRKNLEDALVEAKSLMDDVNYLFIEGNSAANYIKSDLIIYLTDEKAKMKSSAEMAEEKSDIIINSQDVFSKNKVGEINFKFNLDKIRCPKALLTATLMDFKPILIAKKLNQEKVKLTGCQLGCF